MNAFAAFRNPKCEATSDGMLEVVATMNPVATIAQKA
jgi:hypothetical protein